MQRKEDRMVFDIGGRKVEFWRDRDLQRNCFGIDSERGWVLNWVNDVSFEVPEEYLAMVLSFLESQFRRMEEEDEEGADVRKN